MATPGHRSSQRVAPGPWTDQLATALLLTMLAFSIAGLLLPVAETGAGVFTWLAGAVLVGSLPRRQQIVAAALLGVGVVSLGLAVVLGEHPDWRLTLAGNQQLITLLVAVSFLRLAALPAGGSVGGGAFPEVTEPVRERPHGRSAVVRTMALIHLLGAIINVSIIEIVGDRLLDEGPSTRRARLMLLSRSYSSGAFWSPFWGATAAAVTYAPHARFLVLLVVGGTAATIALGVSSFTVVRALGDSADHFVGFPMSRQTLLIPVVLTTAILAEHLALSEVSIPRLIAVTAPALTVLVLVARHPRPAVPRLLLDHARTRLPMMHSEITLFLAAGAVAAGVSSLARSGSWVPFHSFAAPEALVLLLVMVIASMAGIHPVIMIGIAAAFLQPLDPDPTLFAMTCLLAWGIQGAGGPLSGLNIILQSRFGEDSFTIARWNARYVLGLLGLAVGLLPLCQWLDGRVG